MARVQGYKEKLHFPLYDAFFVKPGEKFVKAMTDPRVIRFFVDVQNKTSLETNLQAAGVLPSLNSFEARALRVVVSNVPRDPGSDDENQDRRNSDILADLIYNSVLSFSCGEKEMVKMLTCWFPSGAGISTGFPGVANHGDPNPEATFRFAEAVHIEASQSFRVELSFPHDVPGKGAPDEACRLAGVTGPFRIWVILDGYMTRDVQ